MLRNLYEWGCRLSDRIATAAGHPAAQVGVIAFCLAWFVGLGAGFANDLTLVLSVAAITLTQMVLNQQKRHDAALHLKIDELILAKKGARNELAGAEGMTEEELETLKRSAEDVDEVFRPDGRSGFRQAREQTEAELARCARG